MKLQDSRIFLALPTYDGRRVNSEAITHAMQIPGLRAQSVGASLLAHIFNRLLCEARSSDATHFLMLHDDIEPKITNWVQALWAAYEQSGAELISAVVPIKNDEGETSTAIETADPWVFKRLTAKEIKEGCGMGSAFETDGLVLNTGMMLFDLRAPWVEKCHFEIRDRIVMVDGKPQAQVIPEDWGFTRMARAAGCTRIFATTAVPLEHIGRKGYTL